MSSLFIPLSSNIPKYIPNIHLVSPEKGVQEIVQSYLPPTPTREDHIYARNLSNSRAKLDWNGEKDFAQVIAMNLNKVASPHKTLILEGAKYSYNNESEYAYSPNTNDLYEIFKNRTDLEFIKTDEGLISRDGALQRIDAKEYEDFRKMLLWGIALLPFLIGLFLIAGAYSQRKEPASYQ